jgi:hypothetical protein
MNLNVEITVKLNDENSIMHGIEYSLEFESTGDDFAYAMSESATAIVKNINSINNIADKFAAKYVAIGISKPVAKSIVRSAIAGVLAEQGGA